MLDSKWMILMLFKVLNKDLENSALILSTMKSLLEVKTT